MSCARLSCAGLLLWLLLLPACSGYPNGNPFLRVVDEQEDMADQVIVRDLTPNDADETKPSDLPDMSTPDLAPKEFFRDGFEALTNWNFDCPGWTKDKDYRFSVSTAQEPECGKSPPMMDDHCASFGTEMTFGFPNNGDCTINYTLSSIDLSSSKKRTFKIALRTKYFFIQGESLIIKLSGIKKDGSAWEAPVKLMPGSTKNKGWETTDRTFSLADMNYDLRNTYLHFIVKPERVVNFSFWSIDDVSITDIP